MREGQVYHYGREDGLKGVEARYMYEGNTLYVKIEGSNHWTDYRKRLSARKQTMNLVNRIAIPSMK